MTETSTIVDWVPCPICQEPDMRRETDEEGNALIQCVNHGCASNGGQTHTRPAGGTAELEEELETERRHSDRLAELLRFALHHLGMEQAAIITNPSIAMITLGDLVRGFLALHRERRDLSTEED